MFGLNIKVKCPNCQQDINENLGHTEYVTIDDSEIEYTRCRCHLCSSDYWLSHTMNTVKDVKKATGKEKLKQTRIICW